MVLLQHSVRDQPVGPPGGRVVQADGRNPQAEEEGGRSVNFPTRRLGEENLQISMEIFLTLIEIKHLYLL